MSVCVRVCSCGRTSSVGCGGGFGDAGDFIFVAWAGVRLGLCSRWCG